MLRWRYSSLTLPTKSESFLLDLPIVLFTGQFISLIISVFNSDFLFSDLFHSISIRGKLSSIPYLFRLFGISFSYIAGAYIDFRIIPYVFVPVPILFSVLFTFLPDTPQQLLRTNQFEVSDVYMIHI